MLTRVKRGWEIPESQATPESVFRDRRNLIKAIAAGPILAAGAAAGLWLATRRGRGGDRRSFGVAVSCGPQSALPARPPADLRGTGHYL